MSSEPKCIPRNLTATPLPALWGWQGWYVLVNLGLMFLIVWKDWIRTEFAVMLCLMMIYSAQIITTEEALIGFSNSGVMTVTVLYVVAEGLSATGGVDYFMSKLMGHPRTLGMALTRMMIPVAIVSAFINNTPLVALMIPIIQKWSRKVNIPPSQLMIPLSFATILGGTVTMIGTSTKYVFNHRAMLV
jgi:Na+/H+ antiporter NhaD/arsenite permease-like protein